MTRLDALLHLPAQQEAAPARRWWTRWAQLLCAWVVCMLLCVNVAILLDRGLPGDGEPAQAANTRKTVACSTVVLPTDIVSHRAATGSDRPLTKASNCTAF
ncbi:hypothetical protein [Variovorax sp. DAIF25]|uniref:hypothetical protein n=1 Tax=Variovorax sp. DAIF25 TaxID=3080983 RepID=UPI003D6B9DDF